MDTEPQNIEKNELEKFKINLDFLKFEASLLWQIFTAFFLGNNIFVLVISQNLFRTSEPNYLISLICGFVGFIISALWFGTFRRNSDWYQYRMNQAKKAEEKFVNKIKDDDWYLLNKEAQEFANGPLIKGFKNNISGYVMITLFAIVYLVVILDSIAHLVCNCN